MHTPQLSRSASAGSDGSSAALASLQDVSKRYGGTVALANVDLAFRAHEIHVVAGENGAGKSTLLKLLSGAEHSSEGCLSIAGKPVALRGARHARDLGIATIHQELSLVGSMTVCDNLLLHEQTPPWRWLSRRRRHAQARSILEDNGLGVSPTALVEQLPLAQRQRLEIARALQRKARLIVLDEPTSALPETDVEVLLQRLLALRDQGCGIVYVSHRLEEIERIANWISVLRDGKLVASRAAAEFSQAQLVQCMAGRAAARVKPLVAAATVRPQTPRLNVRLRLQTATSGAEQAIVIRAQAGEILGLAGLADSGANEILRALYGVRSASFDNFEVDGIELPLPSPQRCLKRRIAFVSGDRAASTIADRSIVDNAVLSSLPRFSRGGWVLQDAARAAVVAQQSTLQIRADSLSQRCGSLSGGNQQKVALLRGLLVQPRLLLLEDPTRGIDIATKAEIHGLLRQWAAEGMTILLTSGDTAELASLCSRVLVCQRGRICSELRGVRVSRENIVAASLGSDIDDHGEVVG